MEEFSEARQEWVKHFLELQHSIPDSDTFQRVFEHLSPAKPAECLYDWLSGHRAEGSVVAIDGKTICENGSQRHRAYHVVSAFVAENLLTLGEVAVDEKSNEITAVLIIPQNCPKVRKKEPQMRLFKRKPAVTYASGP